MILKGEKEINAQFDDLAGRINAFSSLALYQMEQIRVKYRPAGLWCNVPLVWQHIKPELFPDPHGLAHALTPISAAAPP